MGRKRLSILEIEAQQPKLLSEKEGTIGYEIKNHIEEINKIQTKEEMVAYFEKLLSKIDDNSKGKKSFMNYLKRKRTVEDMLAYVWDYWFAGDNLRAYETHYIKDCKKGIY